MEHSTHHSGPVEELDTRSVGFNIHYAAAITLFVFNVFVFLRNRQAAVDAEHCRIDESGVVQRGYRRCQLRSILRFFTYLFVIWLQVLLYDVTENKYRGTWSFPPPYGPLSWFSYTRAFLAPWLGTVIIFLIVLAARSEWKTHYLAPVALADADVVSIDEGFEAGPELALVHRCRGEWNYFTYRLRRHTYDPEKGMYSLPEPWKECRGSVLQQVFECRVHGVPVTGAATPIADEAWRTQQRYLHGPNMANVEVLRFFVSFSAECTSFFGIYQYLSIWLMLYWDYITVGIMTFVLVFVAMLAKVSAERMTRLELRRLARMDCTVRMLDPDGVWRHTSSNGLVPGDIVLLGEAASRQVPCDLIIVQGSCIVDESFLSGESLPITKLELPYDDNDRPSSRSECRCHYLYAGTRILQASGADAAGISGVACIAVATAGSTARGELLQSLLYGDSALLPLERDVPKLFNILVLLAFVSFLSVSLRYSFRLGPSLSGVFLVVGLINPLLSVAVMGGQLAGARRLRMHHSIRCRDVRRLAVAGAVDIVLLDKTGTLTKQGLQLVSCLPAFYQNEADLIDFSRLGNNIASQIPLCKEMHLVLAHTHGVQQLDLDNVGQSGENASNLVGQELELRMVKASRAFGWTHDWTRQPRIQTSHASYGNFEVVKVFDFDHETMTMSVIVRCTTDGSLHICCKGSLEALYGRCAMRSRSPAFEERAEHLARTGSYIIACGYRSVMPGSEDFKDLPHPELWPRSRVECRLIMAGALIFVNELKIDAASQVAALQEGGMGVYMVSGDHALTSVRVACLVGIVPEKQEVWLGDLDEALNLYWRQVHPMAERRMRGRLVDIPKPATLAVTGAAFNYLKQNCPEELDVLLRPISGDLGLSIRIFARMSPSQKVAAVKSFQSLRFITCFCGDGGNDACALRAAHTGLGLNGKAEASIAAACSTPSGSLHSVVVLLTEGRSSLCTSVAACRFLVMKGLVQTIGKMVLLFWNGSYMAPLAYLYLDVLVCPFLLWAITQTLPRERGLAAVTPLHSLLSSRALLAPLLCVVVNGLFLYLILAWLSVQSWFVPFDGAKVPFHEWQFRADSFEAPVITLWMCWCVVDVSLLVSYGGDHRRPLYSNWPVLVFALVCHIIHLLLIFSSETDLSCAFKTNCTKEAYKKLATTTMNIFLFRYEKLGGEFYAPSGSNLLSRQFKWQMLVLLLLSSLANHVVYALVETGHASLSKMPEEQSSCDERPFLQPEQQEDQSSTYSSPVHGHGAQGFQANPTPTDSSCSLAVNGCCSSAQPETLGRQF